ncbi:MAG: hypothetical protein AMJ56_03650 [Anaerolineae bacterium SG8_19]|nr:MAG: hypothetical protein AMJ56_03650 [Anaerolineae bacterium SG8_19]
MTNDAPKETKRIPQERWPEFCATFTNGNRGRLLSMEIIGDDVGDLSLTKSTPFAAIDFDSISKGDNFVISYGSEAPTTSHVITRPVELWETQDVKGRVVSLEIVDLDGHKTILNFD